MYLNIKVDVICNEKQQLLPDCNIRNSYNTADLVITSVNRVGIALYTNKVTFVGIFENKIL